MKIYLLFSFLLLVPGFIAQGGDLLDTGVEDQKTAYREADWNRFFGFAYYYRSRALPFRARLYSLEALALARHCQWDAALLTLKEATVRAAQVGAPSADRAELSEIQTHVEAIHRFPKILLTTDHSISISPLFNSKRYWRVRPAQISQIQDPKNIRVRVENLCP